MGFDPKSGLIYAQNGDVPLMLYNFKGLKLREYKLGTGGDPKQFAVSPEGGKLLVVQGAQLYHVDVSKALIAAPPNPVAVAPAAPVALAAQPLFLGAAKGVLLGGDGMDAKNMLPCICWAKDGQSFYVLEKTGTLRRISADGQIQLGKLELGAACGWLTLSAEGPVVTLSGAAEAWLVADDLSQVRNKMRLPQAGMRVVSAPTQGIAAIAGKGNSVTLFDLKTGNLVKQITKHRCLNMR